MNVKNEEFFDVRVPFSNQAQLVPIDCSKEPLFAIFIIQKEKYQKLSW